MSLSSELTRGSLIRLQQSDNGGVALGTFNELLQRQSTCEAETKKRFPVSSSQTCDEGDESCSSNPPAKINREASDVPFELKT